ncbi:hypothetical protein ACQUW0_21120 [Ralstonia pseudosolanacearum]|uniref:hypothetical protein n=1 Tax=Ralstonia pseudosolanacearum TaxID=1310165 RepID=UPI003221F6B9
MRQAGILHDVGHARAVIAAAPDGARSRFDDTFVRGFLGPGGRAFFNMMLIIFILATKCKAIFGMPIELNVGLGIRRAAARSNTAKPSFKVASRQRGLGCIYASDP